MYIPLSVSHQCDLCCQQSSWEPGIILDIVWTSLWEAALRVNNVRLSVPFQLESCTGTTCTPHTHPIPTSFSQSHPLVIFCHIYRPHHHGFTVDFIPIRAVLPQRSSPLPRIYRSLHPHAAL